MHLHMLIRYVLSKQELGQSVRVLPEGCISLCQTRSLQSGVGIAGLGIVGCPLLLVLPLKQGWFSLLLAAAEPLACLCNLRKH